MVPAVANFIRCFETCSDVFSSMGMLPMPSTLSFTIACGEAWRPANVSTRLQVRESRAGRMTTDGRAGDLHYRHRRSLVAAELDGEG